MKKVFVLIFLLFCLNMSFAEEQHQDASAQTMEQVTTLGEEGSSFVDVVAEDRPSIDVGSPIQDGRIYVENLIEDICQHRAFGTYDGCIAALYCEKFGEKCDAPSIQQDKRDFFDREAGVFKSLVTDAFKDEIDIMEWVYGDDDSSEALYSLGAKITPGKIVTALGDGVVLAGLIYSGYSLLLRGSEGSTASVPFVWGVRTGLNSASAFGQFLLNVGNGVIKKDGVLKILLPISREVDFVECLRGGLQGLNVVNRQRALKAIYNAASESYKFASQRIKELRGVIEYAPNVKAELTEMVQLQSESSALVEASSTLMAETSSFLSNIISKTSFLTGLGFGIRGAGQQLRKKEEELLDDTDVQD